MNTRESIDNFILNFNYSFKLKFVIGVSMAAVIWIAIMLLKSHGIVLEGIQVQKVGIEYNNEVDHLLEKIAEHKIAVQLNDTKKQVVIQSEVDQSLKNLAKMSLHVREVLPKDQLGAFEHLLFFEKSINSDWHLLKTSLQEQNQGALGNLHFKLIEELASLMEQSSDLFQLNNNIDSATHRVLTILSFQVPEIQKMIAQSVQILEVGLSNKGLNPKDQARLIINTENLVSLIRTLQDNAVEALKENNTLAENNGSDYADNVSHHLVPIQGFVHLLKYYPSTDPEELYLAAEQALVSTTKIYNDSSRLSTVLIDHQERTLYARKMLGVGFILFGIFVVSLLYMTRFIRQPLLELKNAAEELADGDLSVRVKRQGNDEVARITDAFNRMAEFFEQIMINANEISTTLADTSTNIYKTAKQLESNMFEQEQTINQIASNAKGVSQTVQDFAKSLEEVNKTAAITAHFAALGRMSLSEMESIMQQMIDASTNIVGTLSALQEKVNTINDVINTIIKIADQINLLSLNTAIRASKKGLKGLGFSVVAEKIRELADQTAFATLDMEQVVQQIINSVQSAVQEVDKFSKQVQQQVEDALTVREELIKLISRTQDQISAFDKVNKGMQEQTKRATQIHESINELTDAAQKTTKSVRNLYLEIEYIYHATNNLQNMTKNFTKNSPRTPSGKSPKAHPILSELKEISES